MIDWLYIHTYADGSEDSHIGPSEPPDPEAGSPSQLDSDELAGNYGSENQYFLQETRPGSEAASGNASGLLWDADGNLISCCLHASMYALGKKYLIEKLAAYSLARFRESVFTDLGHFLQPLVIQAVYDGAAPADEVLRGTIRQVLELKRDILPQGADMVEPLNASHEFATDMAKMLLSRVSNPVDVGE